MVIRVEPQSSASESAQMTNHEYEFDEFPPRPIRQLHTNGECECTHSTSGSSLLPANRQEPQEPFSTVNLLCLKHLGALQAS